MVPATINLAVDASQRESISEDWSEDQKCFITSTEAEDSVKGRRSRRTGGKRSRRASRVRRDRMGGGANSSGEEQKAVQGDEAGFQGVNVSED